MPTLASAKEKRRTANDKRQVQHRGRLATSKVRGMTTTTYTPSRALVEEEMGAKTGAVRDVVHHVEHRDRHSTSVRRPHAYLLTCASMFDSQEAQSLLHTSELVTSERG